MVAFTAASLRRGDSVRAKLTGRIIRKLILCPRAQESRTSLVPSDAPNDHSETPLRRENRDGRSDIPDRNAPGLFGTENKVDGCATFVAIDEQAG